MIHTAVVFTNGLGGQPRDGQRKDEMNTIRYVALARTYKAYCYMAVLRESKPVTCCLVNTHVSMIAPNVYFVSLAPSNQPSPRYTYTDRDAVFVKQKIH